MKILNHVLTRARPAQLIAAITAFHELASGDHEVRSLARIDDDDEESLAAVALLARFYPVGAIVRPRPATLGQACNEGLDKTGEWDAVTFTPDDAFPVTPHWDKGVATIIGARGCAAAAWNHVAYPGNCVAFMVSRRYLEAAGALFPELFPFWFTDTWVAQVYELAGARPMPIVSDMTLVGKSKVTAGMRDVGFWVEFWRRTRCLRIEEAERLRHALGWPAVETRPTIEKFERLDRRWNVAAIEAAHGADRDPPTERYLRVKARAEAWLEGRP